MSFLSTLKKFAEWRDLNRPSISNATVEVTEAEREKKRASHSITGDAT